MGSAEAELLAGLVDRPSVYRRNSIAYLTGRAWRAEGRKATIRALRRIKAEAEPSLADDAGSEIAAHLGQILGQVSSVITSVPCGHSRRPDCFGKRLAISTAARLGAEFTQFWADRYCSGSSHPRQNALLPPLEWLGRPERPVIVVDDVATSGWHLEEALIALRSAGVSALGIAWIGGQVQGDRQGGAAEAAQAAEEGATAFGRSARRGRGGWRPGGR